VTKKRDIDLLVSYETGVPLEDVSKITTSFIEVTRSLLVQRGEVRIDGLGRLKVVVVALSGVSVNLVRGTLKCGGAAETMRVRPERQLKVYFSKAHTLTKLLKQEWRNK
jgi:hypothetical protein